MTDAINSPQHAIHAAGFEEAMADRAAFYHPDPAPAMRKYTYTRIGLPPATWRKLHGDYTPEDEARDREAFLLAEKTRQEDEWQQFIEMTIEDRWRWVFERLR